MLNFIDNLVNGITMYRLVLYYLIGLWIAAAVFSLMGLLPFGFVDLAVGTSIVLLVCAVTNAVFAYVFEVPANVESLYITALILVMIITPQPMQKAGLSFLFWASVWAMASKFIFAIGKKHLFNPAAFAVVLMSLTINQYASWWIGTLVMLPFVVVGGILITRKIQRFDLVLSFFAMGIVASVLTSLKADPLVILWKTVVDSPLLFLGFVMLTEPLTTPPTRRLRLAYGSLVGILSQPAVHLASFYFTPEIALLAGNIFSYLVSPKEKYMLKLQERFQFGKDIFHFVFAPNKPAKFKPGQYLEWTLGHKDPDNRGNRRYFTIASSPTEQGVQLGVKFYPNSSTYKKALLDMKKGDILTASQLAGEFTLPEDKQKKLVFIAGGIGVTPFRSIMKYLVDTEDKRSIVLFYCNKISSEIAYKDVFDQAEKQLGTKTVYVLTDKTAVPKDWNGQQGYITPEMIAKEVPDYMERMFYISGPHAMVVAYENVLKEMSVSRDHIKIDFFPGF